MNEDNKVVAFRQPDVIDDPLTSLLRAGANRLLQQAIEAEIEGFLAAMKDLRLPDGRDRMVRHGHGPEWTIQTGDRGSRIPAGEGAGSRRHPHRGPRFTPPCDHQARSLKTPDGFSAALQRIVR